MLSNLVSKELILLDVEANDWVDAIKKTAAPLVQEDKIKESYIDGIIDSVNENGPYFVLLPHVALPHANPEKGALEDAIGIAVLKTPVNFGNADNDPVKYLITLSATSSTNHLSALAVLAELFEQQEFFEMLDNAKTKDDVYTFLENL